MLTSLVIGGGAAPTAALDITNNAVVINYTGASPEAAIRQQILAGRGGAGVGAGRWTGLGITSSTAAADNAINIESRSVAFAENSGLPLGSYSVFRGQPVGANSFLITYARTGDANLDGVVNNDDVTIVGASFAPGFPDRLGPRRLRIQWLCRQR